MAAPYGTSPVTHSALLKFLSITFLDTSGISHVIAIATGILHLMALLPSIFNMVQSWSSTLLSRFRHIKMVLP